MNEDKEITITLTTKELLTVKKALHVFAKNRMTLCHKLGDESGNMADEERTAQFLVTKVCDAMQNETGV